MSKSKRFYFVPDENIREGVKALTKKMMKGQRGWKKDPDLKLLEYQIDGLIRHHLQGYGGLVLR